MYEQSSQIKESASKLLLHISEAMTRRHYDVAHKLIDAMKYLELAGTAAFKHETLANAREKPCP